MSIVSRISARAQREVSRRTKRLAQSLRGDKGPQRLLFVTGCQRSGTSMTYKTFDKDRDAAVYDEVSELSSGDPVEKLRWNPMGDVNAKIAANPARLIVTKPLVESQRLSTLLEHFNQSRALWMYRHYNDVVSSNLKRFGSRNGHDDIAPIFANEQNNWRAELLSNEVRETILNFRQADLSDEDAAALFWYARNSLLFSQGLDDDPRVRLVSYEALVNSPAELMREIYRFIDTPYPGDHIVSWMSTSSIGKGQTVSLSHDVALICNNMMDKLKKSQQINQVSTSP